MGMGYEHILVERSGDFATITMNRPQRRNALSLAHMRELIAAFRDIGDSEAVGVVLAGHGPVFSSGHDLAEVTETDLPAIRKLLGTCTELMTLMQQVPQPVVARVHGLATAAGCQLVASADLAVASEDAGFATPGGKGGWFCHTPMVAVARNVGRKRAMELAMSGDVIDARTALDWGLVLTVPHRVGHHLTPIRGSSRPGQWRESRGSLRAGNVRLSGTITRVLCGGGRLAPEAAAPLACPRRISGAA
jgi:enoyl-CoA hydratase/carnithine racemase